MTHVPFCNVHLTAQRRSARSKLRPTITVPASLIPSGWAGALPLRPGSFMKVAKGAGPFGGFWTPAARPTYSGPRPRSGRAAKHPIAVATAILVLI